MAGGCGSFACVSSHRPLLLRLRSALARRLLVQRVLAGRPMLAAAMRPVPVKAQFSEQGRARPHLPVGIPA